MNAEVQWLKTYFGNLSELPENVECLNYFECGLIDSFGIIELIDEIESHYEITIQQEHFQDRRFSSINGLAAIIIEIKSSSAPP